MTSNPGLEQTAAPIDSPEGAVTALISRTSQVGTEVVMLAEACGRVLATPVVADRASPSLDVSAMDGFAVRLADLKAGPVPIRGEVRIGTPPAALASGTAAKIVTGAAVPAGADAVVRIEDAQVVPRGLVVAQERVRSLHLGVNIRRCGESISAGEVFFAPGRPISPAVVSALASFGVVRPTVFRRVRIGVISTGDEVVLPECAPSDWQLRDSNGPSLCSLTATRPSLVVVHQEHVADDPAKLRHAIGRALEVCDALLLSGGVSMGHRDFVPACLHEFGAEVLFHKLPQRPGRPVLGAVTSDGRPILGLPGNPLSVLVTARRIAVPVLEHMSGLTARATPLRLLSAPSASPVPHWWFRLVSIDSGSGGQPIARIVPGQSSGDVVAACQSDGFVEVPPGQLGDGPWPFYSWTL
ncbi:MAG: molybdopterin molybdotransferase MoeA [Phycisphaerales bacterium]